MAALKYKFQNTAKKRGHVNDINGPGSKEDKLIIEQLIKKIQSKLNTPEQLKKAALIIEEMLRKK